MKPTRKTPYGWQPDLPDHRDHVFALAAKALPPSVDLRAQDTPIYDQGQLGSCTGNSIADAFAFDLLKQQETLFNPSRLFIYYNERAMEGTIKQDAGAQIRDGIKTLNVLGVCDEKLWPYNVAKFKTKPSKAAFTAALAYKSVSYARVPHTEAGMKTTLAGGFPFVLGFTVYESFESDAVAKTGLVPMPEKTEQSIGGHAVLCVGYTEDGHFIIRNSWGPEWGDKGYCYIPVKYLTNPNLCDDLWVVQSVTPQAVAA